ncbi:hypothetical protein NC651_018463 [Populus alba x Populus x berolinensis]|nr:hypothetical protein NC651_018463 [Populus alba x Populus x berolinensis]
MAALIDQVLVSSQIEQGKRILIEVLLLPLLLLRFRCSTGMSNIRDLSVNDRQLSHLEEDDMTTQSCSYFKVSSFEERLAAQRREREMETAQLGFKKPLSKDEKIEKKKQRLAAIGEDLLSIAADQPFRFPATFTFVVRAFSVLDGIGKGLDPRFDITEIAKPYALELLKFREAGVEVLLKDFRKRWGRQSRAFYNLFRQADRVQKLADTIQRLEQGDLKLRVRTLEAERAFQRVAAVQKTVGSVSLSILGLHKVDLVIFWFIFLVGLMECNAIFSS